MAIPVLVYVFCDPSHNAPHAPKRICIPDMVRYPENQYFLGTGLFGLIFGF